MRVAWLTDIHLNFISDNMSENFINSFKNNDPDAILISGDIGDYKSIGKYLRMFNEICKTEIFFVLGNHDYYQGTFQSVKSKILKLFQLEENITWLTTAGVIKLNSDTALIGHDSWADGGYGDYNGSNVMLNDYKWIYDFKHLNKAERLYLMNSLGKEAAENIKHNISSAIKTYNHIILLTHVPPFREACLFEGKISDDFHVPHFSCKQVGDVLLEIFSKEPNKKLTVLCGHTHGGGFIKPLQNIEVHVGEAVYAKPTIQKIFNI